MKIILTAAVSGLGKIGDVVEVKNGYAKNFLIPSNMAICFTANNSKIFESRKHDFEQQSQRNCALANKVKEQVSTKRIVIIENASDDGRLYGSVNANLIADHINKIIGDKIVSRSHVVLAKPIKEVGIYEASLAIHPDVIFDIRLIVTRSDSEVEALLRSEKKSQTIEPESEEKENFKKDKELKGRNKKKSDSK